MTLKRSILRILNGISSRYGQSIIRHRTMLVVGVQLCLIVAANLAAFALRFDGDVPALYRDMAFQALPLVLGLYAVGLWGFDLFHGLWRYVGLHDLSRILWATIVGTIGLFAVLHGVLGWVEYPRSVIILTGFLTAASLAGVRLSVRWVREYLQIIGPTAKRVLMVGAGHGGEALLREIQSDPQYNYRPVGFLDDDPVKCRAKIHGVPVIGTIVDLGRVVRSYEVQEIIAAIPSASPSLMQRILAAAEGCKVPLKTLPSVKHLLNNPISLRRVRPMSLEDLLQREPIQTDLKELHPLLEGKRVLVTGAGGSIGSELCRQIGRYRPETLILFERHENSLNALDLELRTTFPELSLTSLIADSTIPERVYDVFETYRPELVFHAAAHKHVPLMERNPGEAVRNNILGTRILGEASLRTRVDRFIMISSDKAINPTNVMGATKRAAESLVLDLNRHGTTRFTAVRFGNVLGSNGSVVPLFAEQIQRGGPLTVTHPEIRRYFMTIPESVQLVLQASVMGQGGDVFVLDMGEQLKVVDLARNMIVLSGLVPDRDVKIVYTGLRPGEKLFEELFEAGEREEPTPHEKIKRAVSKMPCDPNDLEGHLKELEALLHRHDASGIMRTLQAMVPTYVPSAQV